MDYLAVPEFAAATLGVFILAGTIRGVRAEEVHILVQWLVEAGYERDDVGFSRFVLANLTIAGTLFAFVAARLIELD